MVLRFLGESVTDSNGLAVLPDGYTGTGAGEVDIIAKTVIDDSSLQSETYGVLDCGFYDTGIDSTIEKWAYRNATLTKTVDSTGSLVTNSNSSFGTIYANINESSTWADLYDYSAPLKVEFDIVTISGGGSIALNDGVNPSQITFGTYSFADNTHIELTIEQNRLQVKVGNTTFNWVNHSLADNFGIALRLNDSNASIKFKNFKVYPI